MKSAKAIAETRARMLLLACAPLLFGAPNALAECSVIEPPGPPALTSLIYDPLFNQDCDAWVFEGAEKTEDGAEISGDAYFEQEIFVPSDGPFDSLGVHVQVLNAGAALDRLWVEIRSANGTLLDTVGSFGRTTATGYYVFYPENNYHQQTIKLRFRSAPGPVNGGTTVFLVNEVNLWVF